MQTLSSALQVAGSRPCSTRRGRAADTPTFTLCRDGRRLVCDGIAESLVPAKAEHLAEAVVDFFSRDAAARRMLVGALPFDRAQPAHLFRPRGIRQIAGEDVSAPPPAEPQYRWKLVRGGNPAAFARSVDKAVNAISSTTFEAPLRKVVLARSLELSADRPVDAGRLACRLACDKSVTAFLVQLPDDRTRPGRERCLVGATPELLIAKSAGRVRSKPLAGSARRRLAPAEDHLAARALIGSDKDRREHHAVVEAVLDTLAPYCSRLSAGGGPVLTSTNTMWHLGTHIEGTLKDPTVPCVELLSVLHPTPAVCGFPRERARATIEALEGFDRGFYAGAVGWTDRAGDGEWYVSIRCAEVADSQVRLYAGAGIVEGSDPITETQETAAKFAALLEGLGIDDAALAGLLEETILEVAP